MNKLPEHHWNFIISLTQKEAEDFVYASYLRAATHQDYAAQDAGKRHPELTRSLLLQKSIAPCVVVTGSKGKGSRCQYDLPDPADKFTVGLDQSSYYGFQRALPRQ